MKKTIDELEQLAKGFLNSEIDVAKLLGLDIFERVYVLTVATAQSLTRIGTLSQKACAKIKYTAASEYADFETRSCFFMKSYSEWIRRTRQYSVKTSELSIALAKHDAEKILPLALEIIDLLTHHDIYLKMFKESCRDEDFKKKAMTAAEKDIDKYIERFGNNDTYAQLIEKFYIATDEDKIMEMFARLQPEKLGKIARHVPVKAEHPEDCKGIAESLDKLYQKDKFKNIE